jgi:hypothetical protein
VLAATKHPDKHFKWGTSWTSIVDYVADKPRRTAWHRAYENFFERYPYDPRDYNDDADMDNDEEYDEDDDYEQQESLSMGQMYERREAAAAATATQSNTDWTRNEDDKFWADVAEMEDSATEVPQPAQQKQKVDNSSKASAWHTIRRNTYANVSAASASAAKVNHGH